MSSSNRVLLDKNVARNFLSALVNLARHTPLAESEQVAFELLNGETLNDKRIFIVGATDNILKQLDAKYPEVHDFRNRVEIIVPSHYWRRWSRRLKDFGFTLEDARILGIGTFGTNKEGRFLGVEEFFTFDIPLVTLFELASAQIQSKLDAMKSDIEPPYNEAKLPKVNLLGTANDKLRK